MQIITNKSKIKEFDTAISLGNFDGIHIGHKFLISKMKKESQKLNLKTIVFTFNSHPTRLIETKKNTELLINNEQKANILRTMNIDYLYFANFDKKFMNLSAEEFIENILVNDLRVKLVVVGFNYRFGYKAKGNISTLKKYGKKYGFKVIVVPPVKKQNEIISSTYIRKLIMHGQVKKANIFLGRYYTLVGHVVKGEGRGKILGFPTINLSVSEDCVIPESGVYNTITKYRDKEYKSITNIGKNPTFNGQKSKKINIETHILNFNKDIYNSKVEISFIDYIRPEKKFNKKSELVKQVMQDIRMIKVNEIDIYKI